MSTSTYIYRTLAKLYFQSQNHASPFAIFCSLWLFFHRVNLIAYNRFAIPMHKNERCNYSALESFCLKYLNVGEIKHLKKKKTKNNDNDLYTNSERMQVFTKKWSIFIPERLLLLSLLLLYFSEILIWIFICLLSWRNPLNCSENMFNCSIHRKWFHFS